MGFLDGLRGVAILLVIGYHYFSRWTPPYHSENLYPYSDLVADFWPLKYGGYGVQLFFIISGFVIAMTLNRCSSGWEFFVRRFARLYPAMIFCCAFTFAFISLTPHAPFGAVWSSFVPSLTFLSPAMIDLVFRHPGLQSMDGVYWSLYIEVQFYLMVSIVYFASRERFLRNFLLLCCAIVLGSLLLKLGGSKRYLLIDLVLIAPHLPLFMIGIGLYVEYTGHADRWSRAMIAGGVLLAAVVSFTNAKPLEWLICLLMAGTVYCAFRFAAIQRLLSFGPLTRIGLCSYSLYLIHQYVGVTSIDRLGRWLKSAGMSDQIPALGVGLLVAAAIIAFAMLLYRWIELPAAQFITRILASPAMPAGARAPNR